jgi:hypothetical protein
MMGGRGVLGYLINLDVIRHPSWKLSVVFIQIGDRNEKEKTRGPVHHADDAHHKERDGNACFGYAHVVVQRFHK